MTVVTIRSVTLLVLDNALDHDFYRPVEHWAAAAGFRPDSVRVPAGEPLPDPDRYTHVIVSGSEDTIIARPDWAEHEARWLAEAVAAGAAVLGSCWGHQLLAVALAGPRAVRRSASPEFGWLEISVREPAGLMPEGAFSAFVSHFDEVVPGCHPEMRVLASTPTCAVQAVHWGDRPAWGVQSHPEVDPDTGRGFLQGACERWPELAGMFRQGLDGPVADSGSVAGMVERFLAAG